MAHSNFEQHSSTDVGQMFSDMMHSAGEKINEELHSFSKPGQNHKAEAAHSNDRSQSAAHEHLPGFSLIQHVGDAIAKHPDAIVNAAAFGAIGGLGELAGRGVAYAMQHPGDVAANEMNLRHKVADGVGTAFKRASDQVMYHPGDVVLTGLGLDRQSVAIDKKVFEGLGHVTKDLAVGALNEVKNHPGELLKDAAIGVAVGAAVALAPVEGVAAVAVGVAAAATVGGLALEAAIAHGEGKPLALNLDGAKQVLSTLTDFKGDGKALAKTGQDLLHGAIDLANSTAVDFAPEGHTAAQIQHAHEEVQGVGAFGTQLVAGGAGFGIGSAGMGFVKAALQSSEVAVVTGGGAAADVGAEVSEPVSTPPIPPVTSDVSNVVPAPTSGAEQVVTPTGTPDVSHVASTSAAAPGAEQVVTPTATPDVSHVASTSAAAPGAGQAGAAAGTPEVSHVAASSAPVEQPAPSSGEFANVSPADQAFAARLNAEAAAKGYKSSAVYAAHNLKNPAEIEQFARMYATEDPANAINNIRFALRSERVTEGTGSAWQSALGKAMAKSEFPSATGEDAALAERLGVSAAKSGYKSVSVYGAYNLQRPAEIQQFARMYAADAPDLAAHNLRFAIDSERVASGTASTWRGAVNSIEAAPAQ